MTETKVSRIEKEHEGKETYVCTGSGDLWAKIICVHGGEFWVKTPKGSDYVLESTSKVFWLIREPEPADKLPSVRINEIEISLSMTHGCQPMCQLCIRAQYNAIKQYLDELHLKLKGK